MARKREGAVLDIFYGAEESLDFGGICSSKAGVDEANDAGGSFWLEAITG